MRWPLIAGSLLAAILAGGTAAHAADPFEEMKVVRPKTPVAAPAFVLDSLEDGVKSLADYKGKVVLLNFWATWCEPCRKEMPGMQTLWETYKDRGLDIVAVAGDRGFWFFSKMTRNNIVSFVNELGLTYPVLWDATGDVRQAYEVTALPWSYLIGRDGRIVGRLPGERDWASPQARALIEELLSPSGA